MKYKGFTITTELHKSNRVNARATGHPDFQPLYASGDEQDEAIANIKETIDSKLRVQALIAKMNADAQAQGYTDATQKRVAEHGEQPHGGDDVSLEAALSASQRKPYKPQIQAIPWEDGDYLEIEPQRTNWYQHFATLQYRSYRIS